MKVRVYPIKFYKYTYLSTYLQVYLYIYGGWRNGGHGYCPEEIGVIDE